MENIFIDTVNDSKLTRVTNLLENRNEIQNELWGIGDRVQNQWNKVNVSVKRYLGKSNQIHKYKISNSTAGKELGVVEHH